MYMKLKKFCMSASLSTYFIVSHPANNTSLVLGLTDIQPDPWVGYRSTYFSSMHKVCIYHPLILWASIAWSTDIPEFNAGELNQTHACKSSL